MTAKSVLVQRALLSVSDKTHLLEFAKLLHQQNIEILSTGGTAALLKENEIPVIDVADFTGFPEIMGGRLKTLHPKIHGGILGRRKEDESITQQYDLPPIDLVVVNLYPFEKTILESSCTLDKAIENIDVGGPTMIRAAAKNHTYVTVVIDPKDYKNLGKELLTHQNYISYNTRLDLAAKAFALTAHYDFNIANYMKKQLPTKDASSIEFPEIISFNYLKKFDLRYGENSHQKAAFYVDEKQEGTLGHAVQIQGPLLSYNNIADADAAYTCVQAFKKDSACVIVKHANPCGAAVASTPSEAYQLAFRADPTSAYGGIIAFNQGVDQDTAQSIVEKQFVEVIIAPDFTHEALTIFAAKPKIRLMVCLLKSPSPLSLNLKSVSGGLLVQELDNIDLELSHFHVVTQKQPTDIQLQDMLFAWKIGKYVKSNAIVYAKNQSTVGIGAGQMSRVDSVRLGADKAAQSSLELEGTVMASDAFFPFVDSIEMAGKYGVSAIIQPGGSIRDAEVISKADELGIAMIFTHVRHFRH